VEHPSLRLRLAGTGPAGAAAALRARARELRIEERLDLLGLVSRPALRRLLTDAAVLALPSLYENFGMVVLEALREGCPVVASRETPWEHVDPAGAGRWVDFAAAQSAAEALGEHLEPRRRADAGRAARRLFLEQYVPTSVAPRYVAWYESVVRAWRIGAAA
jgi:glycosyltransferase involved in cell wall biosynthesis